MVPILSALTGLPGPATLLGPRLLGTAAAEHPPALDHAARVGGGLARGTSQPASSASGTTCRPKSARITGIARIAARSFSRSGSDSSSQGRRSGCRRRTSSRSGP